MSIKRNNIMLDKCRGIAQSISILIRLWYVLLLLFQTVRVT